METKTIYREYFPGYMGHIPLKNDVVGMTVGATNQHIKSYLTREPAYEEVLIPSTAKDYTYYNKGYFNENMAKHYELEEDKVFSNRSKEAKTWLCGNKNQLYPQHIPGYTGHVTGISHVTGVNPSTKKGSNIIGMSYAKSTAIAIKGDYNKEIDIPPAERYKTIQKLSYVKPQMRSAAEEEYLKTIKESQTKENETHDECTVSTKFDTKNLSESFIKILNEGKNEVKELPYIVGYKGFRRGVISGNYYGKNFKETSLTSIKKLNS